MLLSYKKLGETSLTIQDTINLDNKHFTKSATMLLSYQERGGTSLTIQDIITLITSISQICDNALSYKELGKTSLTIQDTIDLDNKRFTNLRQCFCLTKNVAEPRSQFKTQ